MFFKNLKYILISQSINIHEKQLPTGLKLHFVFIVIFYFYLKIFFKKTKKIHKITPSLHVYFKKMIILLKFSQTKSTVKIIFITY